MIIYNLNDINKISNESLKMTDDQYKYKLSDNIVELISHLTSKVASPAYIKSPDFQKKDKLVSSTIPSNYPFKKKRNNKQVEISNEEWNSLRSFNQTNIIETKSGIDVIIIQIKNYLNKLTSDTYNDTVKNIINIIDELIQNNTNIEDMYNVGKHIFEIASNNRFYSKLYAKLFTELINNYDIMKEIFDINFNLFLSFFDTIEYVSAEENYEKFCNINKINENRKSLSTFFVNLTINEIISPFQLASIVKNLLKKIKELIYIENKKNEVDEITENIAILYNKEIFENIEDTLTPLEIKQLLIDNNSISETIELLSISNTKSFKSLSNKSIFKFMDINDL
jgi:hypothetical protein